MNENRDTPIEFAPIRKERKDHERLVLEVEEVPRVDEEPGFEEKKHPVLFTPRPW